MCRGCVRLSGRVWCRPQTPVTPWTPTLQVSMRIVSWSLAEPGSCAVPADRALGALDEALGLWRGPVFGDLNGEWWATRPLVKKLDELRLAAMAERIDALTAGGWDARSLAEALSLVAAHPLR